MKIDLHCHSEASKDCLTPLTEFPARCREQGIKVQAITDHTVAQIREQNGLVLLPHGFDPLKNGRLDPRTLEQIEDEINIVETFNARISFRRYNRKAAEWARDHQAPASAGTDAHRLADVGIAWTETPNRPINRPTDLLEALQEGQVKGEWTSPVLAYIQKKFGQWRRLFLLY